MQLPVSITDLSARHAAGERFKYLYFWGHRPRPDGAPSNSCFSQWYPAPFVLAGLAHTSAEHYMMAEMAHLFGDETIRRQIREVADPAAAKALGRRIAAFDEALWNQHRFEIVVRGNLAKFQQNPALGQFLLRTGNQVLVEASPVDPVWGIGLAAADPRAHDPAQWQGLNLLGFALMAVRAQLAAHYAA